MSDSISGCAVREAVATDATAIQNLYRQLVDDSEIEVDREHIETLKNSPHSFLFVCESGGRVRGTVLVSICEDVMYQKQPFAILENLVVSSDSRRMGVGEKLMCEAEKLCLTKDCSKMMLLSSTNRPDAHSFFRAQGFCADTKKGFVKYRRNFSQSG